MLNKSIDLVQLSTNAHNLIDMARADVQFVLQCRRNEWDRALITAKTFANYSQVEYEIRWEDVKTFFTNEHEIVHLAEHCVYTT